MSGNMVYGCDSEIGKAAREAHSAAVAVACGVGFALLVCGWLTACGVRALWRAVVAPAYPDPVCETCGVVLDGSHPACLPPSSALSLQPDSLQPNSLSFGSGPDSYIASSRPVPGMAAEAKAGAGAGRSWYLHLDAPALP